MILSGSQQNFPVRDGDRVVGVVTRDYLVKALGQKNDPVVNEIMHRDVAMTDASDMLEGALQTLQESACHALPVLRNQKLVGLLTAENLGEYLMFKNARNGRKAAVLGVSEATV